MSTGTAPKVTALLQAINDHIAAKEALNESKARLRETEDYFVEMGRKLTGIEKKVKIMPLGNRAEFERMIQEHSRRLRELDRAKPKNWPDWL